MKVQILFTVILLTVAQMLKAQKSTQDSVRLLNEIIVKAYASDRSIQEVPAAIGVVKEGELNRFSPTSMLPAVNMVPGVRMEERSPGSYRFSIRGSSLRSPFGVRNVKFYWNGLPLTDGGGNTYLNLIDFNSIGNMEIIKGPGASLYGAGTGGVVLLESPKKSGTDLHYSLVAGSYGLLRLQGSVSLAVSRKFQLQFGLGYQKSDGYRQQTKMDRLMTQINWRNTLGKKSFLSGTIFTSGLSYQTPGGLTRAQYDQDPSQARPAAGATPGAITQKAAIRNTTGYIGLSFDHAWSNQWSSRIGVFGSYTQFQNPAILNFEKRQEANWGGRTDTQYKFENSSLKGKITFGAEFQQFHSPDSVFDNLQGNSGNLRTADLLRSRILIGFAQAELDLPKEFYLTIGASANFINYQLKRTSTTPEIYQERNFEPVISPRIALLKKLSSALSIYGSISSGFSPPSLAEVRPSTGEFNNGLNPERGVSYEVGFKGRFLHQLDATFALYDLQLKETIINQPVASGADYFINAGATSQRGAELMLAWFPVFSGENSSPLRIWTSYTYNHYRFQNYVNKGTDFSGNKLTGVAPTILVFGADLRLPNGFSFNLTGNYSDRLPLNDANTDYASDYLLLGARTSYTRGMTELFIGIDNALDQHYSLGNDLNAAGGRYFNAAAGRNYYGGIVVRFSFRKNE